jgi:two-component system sensor histidine kinase KdpD
VVVAITGGAESETIVRRAARIASRSAGSELIAVHVVRSDGLTGADTSMLRASRELVEELAGSFHSVVGDDVPEAVIDFARGVNASMVVVGVSRHTSFRQLFTGSTSTEIARLSGPIDVHLVTHDSAGGARRLRRSVSPLSRSRQVAGWVAATVLPVLVTLLLTATHTEQSMPLEVMSYLAVTVLVAMVGGLLPALAAAFAGFLLLNWFFTEPVGRWTVAEPRNLVTLLVFVAIAAAVSSVVDRASRVAADAARARAEATTMSGLSQSVLTGDDTGEAVVARLRATFGLESVSLLARRDDTDGWQLLASDGPDAPRAPETGDAQVRVDDRRVIAWRGRPLRASEVRVLDGFAVQAGLVLEYRRLRERDARAADLEHAEATSTALLRAVSHDLRTPLATIRASVDGLVGGARLGEADRAELLASLDGSTDQLERLIDNLLDLSRISSGLLTPRMRDVSLDEVLPLAVAGQPPGAVLLDLDEGEPLVRTDPGLLERVVANVVANAVRHSGGTPVSIDVHVDPGEMAIRIADRGPGVSEAARERMFEPFQRLGDATPGGLGLGLAVARGLADAVGASLVADDTPGGGLTMVLTVPLAVAGS